MSGNPDLQELSKTQVEELVLLTGDVPELPDVATLKFLRCPDKDWDQHGKLVNESIVES